MRRLADSCDRIYEVEGRRVTSEGSHSANLVRLAALCLTLLPLTCCQSTTTYPGTLAEVINAYRKDQGLPTIPTSPSLQKVAEAHVRDLAAHPPSGACNLHSWSSQGKWSACCYTDDHARATCMWSKPAEIAGYASSGFEIAAAGTTTPNSALDSWRGSEAHHAVILNRGIWAKSTWRAMGAAIHEDYAVVWFGELADAQ